MARRTYNTFYQGIQQDDYLTQGANFIDGKNIDGLRGGYFATLGPKVTELIKTDGVPTGIIDGGTNNDTDNLVGDDQGKIYRFSNADNTPDHTFANAYDVVGGVNFSGKYFIFTKKAGGGDMKVAREEDTYVWDGTWSTVDETWDDGSGPAGKVPFFVLGDYLYYSLTSGSIRRVTATTFTQDAYSFIDSYAVGYSLQGTTIKVYCESGKVYFWDGTSASYTSSQDYGFEIENVITLGAIDYLTSAAGDFYAVSGYSTPTRLSKMQQSLRLEDNSTYQNKLDFQHDTTNKSRTLATHRQDIYACAPNDANLGIYKFGRLFPGLPQGFNKVVTEDPSGNAFTALTDILYHKDNKKLYFGYTANAVNAVSYIDPTVLTTAQTGYLITDVFTGGTTFNKSLDRVRITTSYTSGSNYIKLYVRYDNNATWSLVETINETSDTISRKNISSLTGNFVDVQFKIEIHNNDRDNLPPLLHEFSFDYSIIQQ